MSSRKEHVRYSKRVTATRRWQVLRHQILERDGWQCQCCGERRKLEVDHVKPVRTHPELSFDPRNLQVLCGRCHSRKTRIECGLKERSPERKAWADAVAELATETATPGKGEDHAGIREDRPAAKRNPPTALDPRWQGQPDRRGNPLYGSARYRVSDE